MIKSNSPKKRQSYSLSFLNLNPYHVKPVELKWCKLELIFITSLGDKAIHQSNFDYPIPALVKIINGFRQHYKLSLVT